jgi:ABC-type uncharacterized transport system involved in gliding motility auxiliary subunit
MVAWDLYNGLPSQPNMPPEVVFISEAAGGAAPFNQESVITSELDRLVAIFPGHVTPTADTTYTFTELLRTGAQSGTVEAQECLQNMPFFGPRLTGSPGPHVPDRPELALAAQVTGQIPANDAPAEDEAASEEEDADAETKTSEAKNLNLILVADADIISDGFFQMRAQGEREFHFDNVNFVLNCVDKLAGDAALIEVRNRKPKYRSLTRFEERKAKFDEERAKALERYKEQAEEKLEEAQERFEEQVAAIEERTDLDARTRTILTEQIRKDAQKALDQEKEAIEAERKRNENKAERDYKRSVKRIGNDFKLLSVILPVLPPLLLGIGVWVFQSRRERRSTPLSRSMRRER